MSTPETPLQICQFWQTTPAIRNSFASLGDYHGYLQNPESSPFKVTNQNGRIVVEKNQNQKLSADAALTIVKTWQSDPAIRAEFGSINVFRAYVEATATGKAKILGGGHHVK